MVFQKSVTFACVSETETLLDTEEHILYRVSKVQTYILFVRPCRNDS